MTKLTAVSFIGILLLSIYSCLQASPISPDNLDLFKHHPQLLADAKERRSFVRIGKSNMPDGIWSNLNSARGYDVIREQPMGASRGVISLYRQANNKRRPGAFDSKPQSSFVRLGKRYTANGDEVENEDGDDVMKPVLIGGLREPEIMYEQLPFKQ